MKREKIFRLVPAQPGAKWSKPVKKYIKQIEDLIHHQMRGVDLAPVYLGQAALLVSDDGFKVVPFSDIYKRPSKKEKRDGTGHGQVVQ